MKDKNGLEIANGNDLLSIFKSEEDLRGSNMLEMSDFFSISADLLNKKICTENDWEVCTNAEEIIGQTVSALKCGVDISQMGMLIADGSHFSQDIVEGLKNGTYHIGTSKEVAGNFRPGIFDDKESFVKHFTLKKAVNPTAILSDISTMSILFSLGNIETQLEDISTDVKYFVGLGRRETFNVPFIDAREKIIRASETDDIKERDFFLEEAENSLSHGLNSLYSEVNDLANGLAGKNVFCKLQEINKSLSYLILDMRMIQMYVGMRTYLFNYRGKKAQEKRVLEEYEFKVRVWNEEKVGGGRYSTFELMHSYFPYGSGDIDFWIKDPLKMLDTIDTYNLILDQENMDVFYVTEEDNSNE